MAPTLPLDGTTIIAGIPIPSTSPLFLAVVGLHVLFGLASVVTGAAAMLSRKRRGRHSAFGIAYVRALTGAVLSSAGLAIVRWAEDWPLFVLGAIALASACAGRAAARRGSPGWVRWHLCGMGASYIVLLTAFYVDNGRNLPLWRLLPSIAYWLLPTAIGTPIIAYALVRHPLVRRPPGSRQP